MSINKQLLFMGGGIFLFFAVFLFFFSSVSSKKNIHISTALDRNIEQVKNFQLSKDIKYNLSQLVRISINSLYEANEGEVSQENIDTINATSQYLVANLKNLKGAVSGQNNARIDRIALDIEVIIKTTRQLTALIKLKNAKVVTAEKRYRVLDNTLNNLGKIVVSNLDALANELRIRGSASDNAFALHQINKVIERVRNIRSHYFQLMIIAVEILKERKNLEKINDDVLKRIDDHVDFIMLNHRIVRSLTPNPKERELCDFSLNTFAELSPIMQNDLKLLIEEDYSEIGRITTEIANIRTKFTKLGDSVIMDLENMEAIIREKHTVATNKIRDDVNMTATIRYVNVVIVAAMFLILFSFYLVTRRINKILADLKKSQVSIKNLKEAEEIIKNEQVKAEQASLAKSEFLANMSHEIRTPMNGVIGMVELALDNELDVETKKCLVTIQSEATALNNIINDILDLSKIEAGKLTLEEVSFNLGILIDDIANAFAFRAEDKGLQFVLFLPPETPIQLVGDPAKLRQILVNLVGNAIKFTPGGGYVYVQVVVNAQSDGDVSLCFSVEDNGIGIPADKQESIFGKFTQADSSTTRKYGGTGLGTSISKQLVELMGGEIGIRRQEDKGCNFWFTLNIKKQPEQNQSLSPAIIKKLKDLDVLIVDDSNLSRNLMVTYLKSWGSRPVAVGSVEHAMTKLTDNESDSNLFDLVVVDCQMLEVAGDDFIESLKGTDGILSVPVMVLTAMASRRKALKDDSAAIAGYLVKPINTGELCREIIRIISDPFQLNDGDDGNVKSGTVEGNLAAGKCILLAEDYPTNQKVAMALLFKAGYVVHLVENGKMAVEAFAKQSYDLILMDIQMPEMDGYKATTAIRELERQKATGNKGRVPIIAMTAFAMSSDKQKCLDADMDDYVSKPISRDILLGKIEQWLGLPKTLPDIIENEVVSPADNPGAIRNERSDDMPMDFDLAVKEFGGDSALVIEVVGEFLEDIKLQVVGIGKAIEDKDYEQVRSEAHKIKGGAANLTAKRLAACAYDLEQISSTDNTLNIKKALGALEDEIVALQICFERCREQG